MITIGCEPHYLSLTGSRDSLGKIEAVVRDKWPETLMEGAMPFAWAREHAPDLAGRYTALDKELNELWLNGQITEFKKMSTEWGQAVLQIMKQYAAHLRQREAA